MNSRNQVEMPVALLVVLINKAIAHDTAKQLCTDTLEHAQQQVEHAIECDIPIIITKA